MLLAKGLCRQSTGENLATYFEQGRRRKPEVKAVASKSPTQIPRSQPASISKDPPVDLCQSPKGLQVQNAVKGVKHFTGRTDQLHHGSCSYPKPCRDGPTSLVTRASPA
eukprot:g28309.t1